MNRRSLAFTRAQLLAFKHRGLHVHEITAETGISDKSIRCCMKAYKIAFTRAKPKPVRDVHPWRKHKPFAILDTSGINRLVRNEAYRAARHIARAASSLTG